MKKIINSASEDLSDKLDETVDILKDDFDYILSGLEMLGRSGNFGTAQDIASQLSSSLSDFIEEIANNVVGE